MNSKIRQLHDEQESMNDYSSCLNRCWSQLNYELEIALTQNNDNNNDTKMIEEDNNNINGEVPDSLSHFAQVLATPQINFLAGRATIDINEDDEDDEENNRVGIRQVSQELSNRIKQTISIVQQILEKGKNDNSSSGNHDGKKKEKISIESLISYCCLLEDRMKSSKKRIQQLEYESEDSKIEIKRLTRFITKLQERNLLLTETNSNSTSNNESEKSNSSSTKANSETSVENSKKEAEWNIAKLEYEFKIKESSDKIQELEELNKKYILEIEEKNKRLQENFIKLDMEKTDKVDELFIRQLELEKKARIEMEARWIQSLKESNQFQKDLSLSISKIVELETLRTKLAEGAETELGRREREIHRLQKSLNEFKTEHDTLSELYFKSESENRDLTANKNPETDLSEVKNKYENISSYLIKISETQSSNDNKLETLDVTKIDDNKKLKEIVVSLQAKSRVQFEEINTMKSNLETILSDLNTIATKLETKESLIAKYSAKMRERDESHKAWKLQEKKLRKDMEGIQEERAKLKEKYEFLKQKHENDTHLKNLEQEVITLRELCKRYESERNNIIQNCTELTEANKKLVIESAKYQESENYIRSTSEKLENLSNESIKKFLIEQNNRVRAVEKLESAQSKLLYFFVVIMIKKRISYF